MISIKHSTLAVFCLILIAISDVITRINTFVGESNGSTILILLLNILTSIILFSFLIRKSWISSVPRSAYYSFIALLAWNIISLLHGAFVVKDYWSWKLILTNHIFMIIIPLAMVIGLSYEKFKNIPKFVIYCIFILSIALIPISLGYDTELTSRVAIPVFLMLILLPFMGMRWFLPVFLMAGISIYIDPSYRANVLRILISILILVAFYLRIPLKKAMLNSVMVISMLLPLVFFSLGVSGKFNVFKDAFSIDSAITVIEGGQVRDSPLSADTRTFLYDEVLSSMGNRGSSFAFGQGFGTGYDSKYFDSYVVAKAGRTGSEVGFLNTLMYSGVLGVFIYSCILFIAAFYGINRSRNDLNKMLGIFLSFKWILFFLEDVPRMDMNYFFTWLIVGLCLSKKIRSMNNSEIRQLFQSGKISYEN